MLRSNKTRISFALLALLAGVGACTKHSPSAASSRSYRMGFMSSAPRPDFSLYLQSLVLWTAHSDATIISTEVPWDSLLNGENPVTYVMGNYVGLVNYCRSVNMKLWVYIDPENGLNRASESNPLVARGKSIAQQDIQMIYRRFVVVTDSILRPEHLGLALETNLIRAAAPNAVYQGVKQAANGAAADIRAFDPHVALSISVQAEVAWGKLGGSAYAGVTTDFTDFPFLQELGISSYPYTGFKSPADIPLNYYSGLVATHPLPIFISEGGWTSMSLNGGSYGLSVLSSPAQQKAYIERQGQLLSQAHSIGLFQLTFADLDLTGWPANDTAGLYAFAFLGIVDSNFNPKPALAVWDSLRQQPLEPGH